MNLDFFDMSLNQLNIKRPNISNSGIKIDKPINFDRMKVLAAKLSSGFPHLRVDFYEVNDNLYVGELTFFQGGGMMPFIPNKWDDIFGEWVNLPKLNNR